MLRIITAGLILAALAVISNPGRARADEAAPDPAQANAIPQPAASSDLYKPPPRGAPAHRVGAATRDLSAQRRVALVIGNGAYQHLPRLENPANDAQLIAKTLQSVGFQLIGGQAQTDLDRAGFERAIREFGKVLNSGSVGLFYYAGHGLQFQGANFIVPVTANPVSAADLDFELIDANTALKQMEVSGSELNLVILDACRNNPFGGRGLRDAGHGLAVMRAPRGTLISYATQPDNVAVDGTTGHSPYAAALAEAISRPGLPVLDVFNEVGLSVDRATGGRQQPWVASSPLEGVFYFIGPANVDISDEMSTWAKIKSSDKIDELAFYLDRFPNSRYSEYVRHRLNALRSHPEVLKFRDCIDCPEMVVLPPGSFTMGLPQSEVDRYGFSLGESAPLHLVRIARSFALGEFLVTRKQYATFAEETGHHGGGCNALPLDGTSWKFDTALSWRDPGFAQADDHPVVCVSWDDAVAYANWLTRKTGRTYRLPTEAEWEYAARAGSTAGRYFGGAPICEFANVRDQSKKLLYTTGQFSECNGGFSNTSPVGSFPPNGFGLYDMLGNAWEWVEDCWERSYVDAPVDGTARDKALCEGRVRRGGSWNSDHRYLYNVGSRGWTLPYVRSEIYGFRVASDYPELTSAPPQSLAMAQAPPTVSSPVAPVPPPAPAIPSLSPPGGSGYAAEAQDFGVSPRDSLRQGRPHAPTPLVVNGAKTITTADLYARLMARQPMVLLYVNEDQLGIAGAHWLDGAGRGYAFDDPIQERLGRKVGQLTGGNKDVPVVVLCQDAHCWLSYNAALRIVQLGYRNVFWDRGGREAWKAAGLPLVNLVREPW